MRAGLRGRRVLMIGAFLLIVTFLWIGTLLRPSDSQLSAQVSYTNCGPTNVCTCTGVCEYTISEHRPIQVKCANNGKMVVIDGYVTKEIICYDDMEGGGQVCTNAGGNCPNYPEHVDCPKFCSNSCSGTTQCGFGNPFSDTSCGDPMYGCAKDYHFIIQCMPAEQYNCSNPPPPPGSSASSAPSVSSAVSSSSVPPSSVPVSSVSSVGGTNGGTGGGSQSSFLSTTSSSRSSNTCLSAEQAGTCNDSCEKPYTACVFNCPQAGGAACIAACEAEKTECASRCGPVCQSSNSSRSSASSGISSSRNTSLSSGASSFSIGQCSSAPPLPEAICANVADFYVNTAKQHEYFQRCRANSVRLGLLCDDCEYLSYINNMPVLKHCVGACGTELYDQLYTGETCGTASQVSTCFNLCNNNRISCENNPPRNASMIEKAEWAADCAAEAVTCFEKCPADCPVCDSSSSSVISSRSSVSSSSSSASLNSSRISSSSSAYSNFSSVSSQLSISSAGDRKVYTLCPGRTGEDLSNCVFQGEKCPGNARFTGQTCGLTTIADDIATRTVGLCCADSVSSASKISSSSSVYPPSGVCCEPGACNPFGTCADPYPNFYQCAHNCSVSFSSVSKSSVRSLYVSASSIVISRSSSSITDRYCSLFPWLCTRSSSSTSSISSSKRSSSSSQFSYPPDTAWLNSTSAAASSLSLFIIETSAASVSSQADIYACLSDADCLEQSMRCILNRCLTNTDIAALPSFCGNARLDPGEQCDNGRMNEDRLNASCRTDCTLSRCGDGIVDTPLEQCDDANTINADGCSSVCLPERTAPPATLPAQVVELPFTENSGQWSVVSGQNNLSTTPNQSNTQYQPAAPSMPDTGPAALAIMIAGGAAGWLYRRRR